MFQALREYRRESVIGADRPAIKNAHHAHACGACLLFVAGVMADGRNPGCADLQAQRSPPHQPGGAECLYLPGARLSIQTGKFTGIS